MALDTLAQEQDMRNASAAGNPNLTLVDAWQVFADYDHNANLADKRFGKLRYWILVLGVIATAFAVFYEVTIREQTSPLIPGGILGIWNPSIQSIGKFVVILLPISVTALLTWTNKFGHGKSWILLRGAAESVKREIFLFRTKVGIYNDQHHFKKSREVRLAEKIKQVNERLMKTEVNKDGLETYDDALPPLFAAAEGDDGFSFIYPDQYLAFRLENQMNWYKNKVEKLGKQNSGLNLRIIAIGAIGTLLAAIGFEVWVAVTTAIAAAFASYLEYNQYEDNLTSYNQTGRDLESLRMWWRAVPDIEKEQHTIYERLVTNAENIMSSEHTSWIQNMQDALEELYEEDTHTEEAMLEIIERFQNDPDSAYFVDEDDDYVSAEELDMMGFVVKNGDNGASNGSAAAINAALPVIVDAAGSDDDNSEQGEGTFLDQTIASFTEEATETVDNSMDSFVDDYQDDAVDFLSEAVKDKVEDVLDNFVDEDTADTLLESLDEMIDEKTSDLVDSAATETTDLAKDFLDDKTDDFLDNIATEATEQAEDFLDNKADDFIDTMAIEATDHVPDMYDTGVEEAPDAMAAEATDQLNELFNDLGDKPDDDVLPSSEPPDMLDELFGDIGEEDDDDDLSDLFAQG